MKKKQIADAKLAITAAKQAITACEVSAKKCIADVGKATDEDFESLIKETVEIANSSCMKLSEAFKDRAKLCGPEHVQQMHDSKEEDLRFIRAEAVRIVGLLKANRDELRKRNAGGISQSTTPPSMASFIPSKDAVLSKGATTETPTTNSSQADPTATGPVSYANAVKAPKPKPKCEPIVRVSQSNLRNEATARALSDACNESAKKTGLNHAVTPEIVAEAAKLAFGIDLPLHMPCVLTNDSALSIDQVLDTKPEWVASISGKNEKYILARDTFTAMQQAGTLMNLFKCCERVYFIRLFDHIYYFMWKPTKDVTISSLKSMSQMENHGLFTTVKDADEIEDAEVILDPMPPPPAALYAVLLPSKEYKSNGSVVHTAFPETTCVVIPEGEECKKYPSIRLDLLTSKLEAECKANLRFTNNAEGAKLEFAAKKIVIAAAAKVLHSKGYNVFASPSGIRVHANKPLVEEDKALFKELVKANFVFFDTPPSKPKKQAGGIHLEMKPELKADDCKHPLYVSIASSSLAPFAPGLVKDALTTAHALTYAKGFSDILLFSCPSEEVRTKLTNRVIVIPGSHLRVVCRPIQIHHFHLVSAKGDSTTAVTAALA